MEFNDDEIVALLNRLLEKLHQADSNHQGSIVLNIYGKGSLHVDHVDTQNFYGDACPKPQKEKGNIDAPTLPLYYAPIKRWCYGRKLRMRAMWMPTINRLFPERRRHCWPMR